MKIERELRMLNAIKVLANEEESEKMWPERLKAKCDLCAEATLKTLEAIDREACSRSVIREMEAAAAARIVDKLITGFAKKMNKLCEKYPWLDEALTVELHFGTKPKEEAQAGEREKIGPDALQRMADVFSGPEAER